MPDEGSLALRDAAVGAGNEALSLLVVEDDPVYCEMVTAKLAASHPTFDLLFAGNVQEALSILSSRGVDCVLLEHYLPDGVGSELLEHARYQLMLTPVVGYSACTDAHMAVEQYRMGCAAVLTKEEAFEGDNLRGTILDVIERYRARASAERVGSAPELLRRVGKILHRDAAPQNVGIASVNANLRLIHEAAIQTMSEGIVLVQHRSDIVFANPGFKKMLGLFYVEDLPGHPSPTVDLVLSAESLAVFRNPNRKTDRYEARLLSPEGMEIPVRIAEMMIGDDAVLCTVTDLREAKEQERRLCESNEALEEKNRRLAELCDLAQHFLDHVSHEFRAPLTVIREFATILRDGLAGATNDEQRKYLDVVVNRVDDLVLMVNDLLDSSRLEAGLLTVARKPCRLSDIVARISTTLERKAIAENITLDIKVDDGLPTAYCDPEKIGRVLVNLTVNAIKFSDEGGHVHLWAREDAGRSQILCGVTDDGPGIAKEDQGVVFERFRQIEGNTRAGTKGFGLGLNIAKELVELNFGEITVESEPGHGSTFSFTIPTAEPCHVIRRYLDFCTRQPSGSSSVSLLTGALDASIGRQLADAVEGFLQQLLRPTDLMFRVASHKWVLAVRAREDDANRMITRIEKAWTESDRTEPAGKLPQVRLAVGGAWRVHEQYDELVAAFQHALHRAEGAHT